MLRSVVGRMIRSVVDQMLRSVVDQMILSAVVIEPSSLAVQLLPLVVIELLQHLLNILVLLLLVQTRKR